MILGKVRAVKALLANKKTRVTITDKNGVTPLHLATAISYYNKKRVGKYAKIAAAGGVALSLTTAALIGYIASAVPAAYYGILSASAAAASGPVGLLTGAAALSAIVAVDIVVRNRILQMLIDRGARVNAKDKDGNTPLHTLASGKLLKLADRRGGVIMAQHLINWGADVTIKNKTGKTPFVLAVENGRKLPLLEVLRVGPVKQAVQKWRAKRKRKRRGLATQ